MSADDLARHARRVGVLAGLAIAAALVAGFGLGLTAERLWFHRRPHGAPWEMGRGGPPREGEMRGPPPGERDTRFRRRMADQLARDLDLTAEQRRKVDSLLEVQDAEFRTIREEMRPKMQAFFERSRAALDSLLTPAQRERFRTLGPPPPR